MRRPMREFSEKRALGRLLALMLCLFAVGVVRGDDKNWQSQMSTIRWVAYSPSTGNPDQQIEPSKNDIRKDLTELRKAHFSGLVTYTSRGPLGVDFINLARAAGFEGIIIGVWDPNDPAEL